MGQLQCQFPSKGLYSSLFLDDQSRDSIYIPSLTSRRSLATHSLINLLPAIHHALNLPINPGSHRFMHRISVVYVSLGDLSRTTQIVACSTLPQINSPQYTQTIPSYFYELSIYSTAGEKAQGVLFAPSRTSDFPFPSRMFCISLY